MSPPPSPLPSQDSAKQNWIKFWTTQPEGVELHRNALQLGHWLHPSFPMFWEDDTVDKIQNGNAKKQEAPFRLPRTAYTNLDGSREEVAIVPRDGVEFQRNPVIIEKDENARLPTEIELRDFFHRRDGKWIYPNDAQFAELAKDKGFRFQCALCSHEVSSYKTIKALRDHWFRRHPTKAALASALPREPRKDKGSKHKKGNGGSSSSSTAGTLGATSSGSAGSSRTAGALVSSSAGSSRTAGALVSSSSSSSSNNTIGGAGYSGSAGNGSTAGALDGVSTSSSSSAGRSTRRTAKPTYDREKLGGCIAALMLAAKNLDGTGDETLNGINNTTTLNAAADFVIQKGGVLKKPKKDQQAYLDALDKLQQLIVVLPGLISDGEWKEGLIAAEALLRAENNEDLTDYIQPPR